MASKWISCADTAKLIRQSLKEAFPRVKFSVRSSVYSGGASIRVGWTDGPNQAQVESVAKQYAGAYFDGSIDYQGSIYHMNDKGEQIHFGANFVFCDREYSDAAVQRAINAVYRNLEGNFKQDGKEIPTVAQFRNGGLYSLQLSGLHFNGMQSVQHEIFRNLGKHSDRLHVEDSPTCNKYFVTHDDGYSRACGSGRSAVDAQDLAA